MKLTIAKKSLLSELKKNFPSVQELNHVKNCEAFENKVLAKVSPRNIQECSRLVEIAREHQIALYPLASGKNWGFGASVPPTDHCLLMDLSAMNKISNYDESFGSLRIQAGVTQKQVYDFLNREASSYRIDVTGSGEDTSILGNALERGLGYQALRHEHILSMKILLMDGTLFDTGYGRFPDSPLGKCLSYGLGPSLNHLFTQSNFGIVLEATLKLIKKCEYECAFSFAIKNEKDLETTSVLIKEFFDDSIINSIPKVFDKRRCEVTFCPKYYAAANERGQQISRQQIKEEFEKNWGDKAWTFVTSLAGPRALVQSKITHIQNKLKNLSAVRIVDQESLEKSPANTFAEQLQKHFDKLILGYLQGKPSNDALMSTYWDVCDFDESPERPEDKEYGFLYITPLVPNSPAELRNFLITYKIVCDKFLLSPAMTLNFLNRNSIESVISLTFNKKNPFEIKKAHNFKSALQKELLVKGYFPYRLDTAAMQNFYKTAEENSWEKVCGKIKEALDPENILAPGRYSKK